MSVRQKGYITERTRKRGNKNKTNKQSKQKKKTGKEQEKQSMIQNNKNNWLYGLQVVALNRLSFTFCFRGKW